MSQHVLKERINLRELRDVISFGYRHDTPIFILGGAGVGKSAIIQQIADVMFPKFKGKNVVDFRLSDKAPQDATGIAIPIERADGTVRTVFATPDWWPTDPDWEGFIFLDELTNAEPALQQIGYQIMLDRQFIGYKFPKKALPIGAGNREGDGGSTHTLLSPLVNRMILVEVDYDYTVWNEDYAEPKGLHPALLGFLKQFPQKLYTGDADGLEAGKPYASPRAYDKVSNALFDLDKKLISSRITAILIQGSVGEGLETEILNYHTRVTKLPDMEKVFKGEIARHSLQTHEVDLIYVFGVASLWQLRKDVEEDKYSDQEIMQRTANWISFMFESFKAQNVDLVIGFVTQIIQKVGDKPAILTCNEKRNSRIKMIPNTLKNSPALAALVTTYMADHMALLEDISNK